MSPKPCLVLIVDIKYLMLYMLPRWNYRMLLYHQITDSEMIYSIVTVGVSSGASSQDFNLHSVVYHLSDGQIISSL